MTDCPQCGGLRLKVKGPIPIRERCQCSWLRVHVDAIVIWGFIIFSVFTIAVVVLGIFGT